VIKQSSSRPTRTRIPRSWFVLLSMAAALSLLFSASPACADVSSWAFVGGGASRLEQSTLSARTVSSMRLHIGMGSDPSHPFIVGGLFSLEPHFGYGSDLALSVRTATRGYVNGQFGLALDLGGYERLWGERTSAGGTGTLWLGAPWGITLGAGASVGTNDAREVSVILGIDFARLTVYRNAGTSWFMNPFPAYRPASSVSPQH
jgi:hypothetical protein